MHLLLGGAWHTRQFMAWLGNGTCPCTHGPGSHGHPTRREEGDRSRGLGLPAKLRWPHSARLSHSLLGRCTRKGKKQGCGAGSVPNPPDPGHPDGNLGAVAPAGWSKRGHRRASTEPPGQSRARTCSLVPRTYHTLPTSPLPPSPHGIKYPAPTHRLRGKDRCRKTAYAQVNR